MANLDVTRLTGTNLNGSIDPDSGQLTLEGTRITVDHFRFEGNLEDAERAGLLAGATDPALDIGDGTDRIAEAADAGDADAVTTPDPELPSANYARPESYANGVYAEAASADAIGEGMKGEHVRAKQQELADAGYDLGEHGVDGYWGPDTQAAWTEYQANGGRPLSEVDANEAGDADRAKQHEVMTDAYEAQADTVTATDAPEFAFDADARTLRVDGTADGDRLRLSYDRDREAYDLNFTNADGEESLLTSVPGADLDRVEIAGRGGDDTIFLDPSLNDAERRIEIGAGGNAGDDVILNAANGATLVDGDGDDRYLNSGDDVTIGQYRPGVGEAPVTGSDAVMSVGDNVHVSLGNDGDHLVMSEGDRARVVLGDGDNLVATEGERNRVVVGDGDNVIHGPSDEEVVRPLAEPIEI